MTVARNDAAATFVVGAGGSSGTAPPPDVPVDFKDSVMLATTGNITLTGEQVIDGQQTNATRVLVKDQDAGPQNGLYVSGPGAWARAPDADTEAKVTPGMIVYVESGTTNTDKFFGLATDNPIILGRTPLVFQGTAPPTNLFVYKTVPGTSYTHTINDAGKRLLFISPDPKELIIAPQSEVSSAVNAEMEAYNDGAGVLTIKGGAGVIVNGRDLTVGISLVKKIKKRASPNTWDVT